MFYIALYFGTYSTIFSDFLHPNCNNKNMYILEIGKKIETRAPSFSE